MATSFNYYKGQSLADFLPENETNQQPTMKPQPSPRQQYSYCSNEASTSKDQSKGANSDPPDPGEVKQKANQMLPELEKTKDNLKKALKVARDILFQEYTNTNNNAEKVKKYSDIVKEIARKWKPTYDELYKSYNILGTPELAHQLHEENMLIENQIATFVELDGEGNQEEISQNSPLQSPQQSSAPRQLPRPPQRVPTT